MSTHYGNLYWCGIFFPLTRMEIYEHVNTLSEAEEDGGGGMDPSFSTVNCKLANTAIAQAVGGSCCKYMQQFVCFLCCFSDLSLSD